MKNPLQQRNLRSTGAYSRPVIMLLASLVLALGTTGCEKVTKENLDKWVRTSKGPGKLKKAFADQKLEPALAGRAGRNLVLMDEWVYVKETLEKTPDAVRLPLVDALSAELWDDAKNFPDRLAEPIPRQIKAKDALYELRAFASPEGKTKIEDYLIEWLSGYYEGRATKGRIPGRQIVREIGARSVKGLMQSANSVLAAPAKADGSYVKMGDELLLGLAVSGSPEATALILDLAEKESKDESLRKRAMGALVFAYVDAKGFEPADPKGLAEHADRLSEIIKNPELPGLVRNDAVQLVAAMGMPGCLPIFVDMVSYPADKSQFKWIGLQQGVRCGASESIIPLAEALPAGADYEGALLKKYFWDEVLSLKPRSATAEKAETLLSSENWVARISGIELLGEVGLRGRAAGDAAKIRALSKDGTVLRGWWGEKGGKRAAPKLGARASEVAKKLEKVAKK